MPRTHFYMCLLNSVYVFFYKFYIVQKSTIRKNVFRIKVFGQLYSKNDQKSFFPNGMLLFLDSFFLSFGSQLSLFQGAFRFSCHIFRSILKYFPDESMSILHDFDKWNSTFVSLSIPLTSILGFRQNA